jgi:hypothetical protein
MIWDSVHQFVPTLIQGDAIGDYTLWVREKLLEKNIQSEIFVGVENNETQNITHSFGKTLSFSTTWRRPQLAPSSY